MTTVRILLFYYWISLLSANIFLAANTAFSTLGNPVYGIHCKNVSITFSGDINRVMEACRQYHVKLIVLTHAHFDHAENAAQISSALGIPIGMSEKDCNLIQSNANQGLFAETFLGKIVLWASLKDFSVRTLQEFKPDIFLEDGDSLSEYGVDASIIALPGHTDGSIGIDVDSKSFIVGDALMNMFYPTVSMLFHDKSEMLDSAGKISRIGNRTIYFGHGKPVPNKQWVKQRTVRSMNWPHV